MRRTLLLVAVLLPVFAESPPAHYNPGPRQDLKLPADALVGPHYLTWTARNKVPCYSSK